MCAYGGGTSKRDGALIFPDGKVTRLIFPNLEGEVKITSAAINSTGRVVIGGYESVYHWPRVLSFAKVVDPEGKVTKFYGSDLPDDTRSAKILSVAINPCGNGLIEGYHYGCSYIYAAKIMRSGEVLALKSSAPAGHRGRIRTVSMNETGQGLIGGFFDESTHSWFYAARVDVDGNALCRCLPSSFPSEKGQILAFTMSASGRGTWLRDIPIFHPLLTGHWSLRMGLSFFLKIFLQKRKGGKIHSVAMHSLGIAIIGGVKNRGSPYTAFVAVGRFAFPRRDLLGSLLYSL